MIKNGRAMGGHKGRCRGIPYYPKNQTAGKDLVTTAINYGSSGIPLYVCDRCGKNDFPNGHALGGHKRYCGKPQYYSSVTKDNNNNAGLQPQKKRKIIRKRKVTSKSKKGTNTSNTTISKRTHVLFQGRSNSNNNSRSSRATNRKKLKKLFNYLHMINITRKYVIL